MRTEEYRPTDQELQTMTELKELSQLCEAQFRNPDVGIDEIPTHL